ncbi:hypothetical protein BLA17378_08660 [Burkholderia aenigmatica]|uniref:Uncharacterized protein n=1 Tax=Burkholderia aenigmatica TaxID=2015348 RepID=A0ABY6Y7J9_9BURK|nr:hypothetical protein BLA17378_08660 [Burkholderia aenigmatica]
MALVPQSAPLYCPTQTSEGRPRRRASEAILRGASLLGSYKWAPVPAPEDERKSTIVRVQKQNAPEGASLLAKRGHYSHEYITLLSALAARMPVNSSIDAMA